MAAAPRRAVLFRAAAGDDGGGDAYGEAFAAAGLAAETCNTLSFSFEGAAALAAALRRAEFEGAAATSVRGLEAAAMALQRLAPDERARALERLAPLYVVGAASEAAGQRLGLPTRRGGDAVRDAATLGALIAAERKGRAAAAPPLLVVAGSRSLPALRDALGVGAVAHFEVVAYESAPTPPAELARWWAAASPPRGSVLVFFSPSGVAAADAAVGPLIRGGEFAFAALGATTGEAISRLGWAPLAVAKQPDAKALAEAAAAAAAGLRAK
jgi:uroporphyrinogen-III synthase